MVKFWKKVEDVLLESPEETMGFSKELTAIKQSFMIKRYDFSSPDQVEDIKRELLNRRILIVNAKFLLESFDIAKVKRIIEELKIFLREKGGSMARLGDYYLILTPNSIVKIAN
ncbi:MAG: cell division protein SepF [Promethearchaeota archaeon]